MLKMAPVLRYTEFSPSSCLAGNFPQVVRLHVADKVWDNHFELLDCRWLASNYMGKYIAPKWEVHGWQIWRVWGPYVFSLPGNHSSSKLRLKEIQTGRCDMTACTILLEPYLLFGSCTLHRIPNSLFEDLFQVYIMIDWSFKPDNGQAGAINKTSPAHNLLSKSFFCNQSHYLDYNEPNTWHGFY